MSLLALECYRGDSAEVMASLLDGRLLEAYAEYIHRNSGNHAEAGQLGFDKRMLRLLARLGAEGVDGVASNDRAGLDALLTDCFAVATWQRWPLPIEPAGTRTVEVAELQRGLLGSEREGQGAALYLIDEGTIGLRRSRDDDTLALREQ